MNLNPDHECLSIKTTVGKVSTARGKFHEMICALHWPVSGVDFIKAWRTASFIEIAPNICTFHLGLTFTPVKSFSEVGRYALRLFTPSWVKSTPENYIYETFYKLKVGIRRKPLYEINCWFLINLPQVQLKSLFNDPDEVHERGVYWGDVVRVGRTDQGLVDVLVVQVVAIGILKWMENWTVSNCLSYE